MAGMRAPAERRHRDFLPPGASHLTLAGRKRQQIVRRGRAGGGGRERANRGGEDGVQSEA